MYSDKLYFLHFMSLELMYVNYSGVFRLLMGGGIVPTGTPGGSTRRLPDCLTGGFIADCSLLLLNGGFVPTVPWALLTCQLSRLSAERGSQEFQTCFRRPGADWCSRGGFAPTAVWRLCVAMRRLRADCFPAAVGRPVSLRRLRADCCFAPLCVCGGFVPTTFRLWCGGFAPTAVLRLCVFAAASCRLRPGGLEPTGFGAAASRRLLFGGFVSLCGGFVPTAFQRP